MDFKSQYQSINISSDGMDAVDQPWFKTVKVAHNIYLTREFNYFEGNRANIWLIKGPDKDVIIDCGLGVQNLRHHFERLGLLSPPSDHDQRPCDVICTHVHFDHSGGAHHFDRVFIHELDQPGLQHGMQIETLNYVKASHFYLKPYTGFCASSYKVPPTNCLPLRDKDRIDLGDSENIEIMHVPGHTKGSIAVYYEKGEALFTGDFVYECQNGGRLLDWLPTSSIYDYVYSADMMSDWLLENRVAKVYPGHFDVLSVQRTHDLLQEYIEAKSDYCNRSCTSSLQSVARTYFFLGCSRCCPC